MKRIFVSAALLISQVFVVFGAEPLVMHKASLDGLVATNRVYFNGPIGRFPSIEHDYVAGIHIWDSVYVRDSMVRIVFTFYNPNTVPSVGVLRYTWGQFVPDLRPGDAVAMTPVADPPITVPAQGTANVTVELVGLPNVVTRGWLRGCVNVETTQGSGYIELGQRNVQHLYVTDRTPTNFQTVPWTEVLDDTCTWLDNGYGIKPASRNLAEGLYTSGRFLYNGGVLPQWVDTETGFFNLSDFVAPPRPTRIGNCVDVSSYLSLCLQSQGHSELILRLRPMSPGIAAFRTNLIVPIGHSTATQTDWTFHSIVADAYADAVDASAMQLQNLQGEYELVVPWEWQVVPYWQTPVGTERFAGLVDGPTGQPTGPVSLAITFHSLQGIE